MTNEELVNLIKAGINPEENMLILYNQVKGFIYSIALRYRGLGEIEDLEQEGFLSLYDAIDGYDPSTGNKFLTYAQYWIIQGIKRYIERNSCCLHLPSQIQGRLRRYKQTCDYFTKEFGRDPSEVEIAAFMGLSIEQVRDINKNANMANLVSLDAPVKGFEEDGFTTGDNIPSDEDMEETIIDGMQQEQLKTVIWECVDSLEGMQPEVIRKRYQDNMTLEAIGKECGVPKSAVRRDEAKAIRELRKPVNGKKLRPFLPETETIYSMGISSTGYERFNQTWTSATERAALRFEA
ncbi:MAG: polymerase sigma factor, sigma-70 family [Firmicutes bacterium]|nr:polymerase sigma factor, sigma-70 family [Bacillota bacterium]